MCHSLALIRKPTSVLSSGEVGGANYSVSCELEKKWIGLVYFKIARCLIIITEFAINRLCRGTKGERLHIHFGQDAITVI